MKDLQKILLNEGEKILHEAKSLMPYLGQKDLQEFIVEYYGSFKALKNIAYNSVLLDTGLKLSDMYDEIWDLYEKLKK